MKLNRLWRASPNCRGTGLLELLLSICLAMVMLTSLFALYYGAAKGAAKNENRTLAYQEADMVTERLVRDFRMPGLMATPDVDGTADDINRDVPGKPWSDSVRQDFEYANTYEVVFTADFDNDNHTETVDYKLDNVQHALIQTVWRWSRDSLRWLVPVTRQVGHDVDYLAFKFYDKDGATIPNPVTYPMGGYTLGVGERPRVTEVEITVVTHSEHTENARATYTTMPDGTHWYDKMPRLISRFKVRGRNLSLGA